MNCKEADKLIPLFLDDGLIGCSLKIKSEGSNIKNNPWDKNDTNTQPLEKGKITIFGDKNQPVADYPVHVVHMDEMLSCTVEITHVVDRDTLVTKLAHRQA